ncbi:MAG: hypothetical protein IK114_02595 [Fibrobacter sp.]|nr:hypothetical protein [Fibrobacter sp.]
MRKRIFTLILLFSTLTFADRIVIDTSMATSTENDYKDFEDRGSFGPYVEFSNIKMKNVVYSYKVNGIKEDINIDNTYIYGASGSLPLTEWFDIYLMAGYQYLGISHKPRNRDKAYQLLAEELEFADDFFEASFDSTDIEGRHEIHTALFQLGFDFALPLVMNYRHQFMIKLYAFGGAVFGKTFFGDDTKFTSPAIYGYAYGAGVRMAWHSFFLSSGFRNSHEYFHTYFERKTGTDRENDEFMLDFDTYFQPYVSLGITLF